MSIKYKSPAVRCLFNKIKENAKEIQETNDLDKIDMLTDEIVVISCFLKSVKGVDDDEEKN